MDGLKLFIVNSYIEDGMLYYEDSRVVIAETSEEAACMVRQLIWDMYKANIEDCDVSEVAFEKGILGVPNREVQ